MQSTIDQNFMPYLAGLDGMYCLKGQRPLYAYSCSSIHVFAPGTNPYLESDNMNLI